MFEVTELSAQTTTWSSEITCEITCDDIHHCFLTTTAVVLNLIDETTAPEYRACECLGECRLLPRVSCRAAPHDEGKGGADDEEGRPQMKRSSCHKRSPFKRSSLFVNGGCCPCDHNSIGRRLGVFRPVDSLGSGVNVMLPGWIGSVFARARGPCPLRWRVLP